MSKNTLIKKFCPIFKRIKDTLIGSRRKINFEKDDDMSEKENKAYEYYYNASYCFKNGTPLEETRAGGYIYMPNKIESEEELQKLKNKIINHILNSEDRELSNVIINSIHFIDRTNKEKE